MSTVSKHFVTFRSPGTFFAEETEKPIESWDIPTAVAMAATITERYNAKPYGFVFTTRSRDDNDLDSHETARSGMHFIGAKLVTLAEVEARNNPKDAILLSNMRGNGYSAVVEPDANNTGWRWCQPFNEGDILL